MPGLMEGARPRASVEVAAEVKAFDWEERAYYVEGAAIVEDPLQRLRPAQDPRLLAKSVGLRTKAPRQRAQYPDAHHAGRFLPAPLFPGTTGHGVVTSYLASDNALVRDPPSPRTEWTRRVLHPVLSGHAASFTPY